MREILFRGKTTDNGEWVEGYYCPCSFGRLPFRPAIVLKGKLDKGAWEPTEIIQETLCQYTGLKDINGNKIFEGDIVKDQRVYWTHLSYAIEGIEKMEDAEKYKNYGEIGVVEFNTEDVASCGCCYEYFTGTGFRAKNICLHTCEIIGNIYDNPELLEDGE